MYPSSKIQKQLRPGVIAHVITFTPPMLGYMSHVEPIFAIYERN